MSVSNTAAEQNTEEQSVGRQIRALRRARKITLAELALSIGKSVGYVSQVERGLSEVSLTSLGSIAAALDVQTSFFFVGDTTASEDERGFITRHSHRRQLNCIGSGVSEAILSPTLSGESLMILTRTQPGGDGGEPIRRSIEESGLVLSGTLELQIDDRWFTLDSGDSFTLPRNIYHAFKNTGDSACEVVWFLTPANY